MRTENLFNRISPQACVGLAGYTLLGLVSNFCFKECGTNPDRMWFYFILGNTFGPLSLIFLMWVYARMHANLVAALSMGLSAVSVQVAFWWVYKTHLVPIQWAGIGLAIIGGLVAVSGNPATGEAAAGQGKT